METPIDVFVHQSIEGDIDCSLCPSVDRWRHGLCYFIRQSIDGNIDHCGTLSKTSRKSKLIISNGDPLYTNLVISNKNIMYLLCMTSLLGIHVEMDLITFA